MVSAKTLAVAVGIPAGILIGPVGVQMYKAGKQEREAEREKWVELHLFNKAMQAIPAEQKAIDGLEQSVEHSQKSIETVEAEIAAVQQRLGELRDVREARVKEAAEAAGALEEARAKLARVMQDARRHQQAASAANAALEEARHAMAEAKKGFNPLHHPLVRSFLDRQ